MVTRKSCSNVRNLCAQQRVLGEFRLRTKKNWIMKKLISRRNFLAAMGAVAAAGVLTACGGSSSGAASSAAASSTAASAAESWGDLKMTMWGAEEDQTMLREMAAVIGIMVFIICAVFTLVCFRFLNKKEATFS